MSDIVILSKNNEQLGPFTPAEVRQGLTLGKYRQTQLAFADGLTEWTPLMQVLLFVEKGKGSGDGQEKS